MANYQKLYTLLFNGITDAVELLNKLDVISAKELLITLQQKAEDAFIEDDE